MHVNTKNLKPFGFVLEYSAVLWWCLLVFGGIFLLSSPGYALDPTKEISQYVIDIWGLEEGLPNNSVNAILRTRDGYLWLGTEVGLVRFDGVRFEVFDKRRVKAMSGNFVQALCEDREGSLWIGTRDGLLRLQDGGFTAFTTRQGLAHNHILALLEDRAGNLWIGTNGGGLSRLKDGGFTTFTTGQGLAHNRIQALHEDRAGNLWIGTHGGGLSRMKDGRFTTYSTKTTPHGLPNDIVFAVYEDRAGTLWVGTEPGLVSIEAGQFTNSTDIRFTVAAPDAIQAFDEDRNGNLWVGTYVGLGRLLAGKFTKFTRQEDLGVERVQAIHEDADGSLWIGMYGLGLVRLQDGKFTTYTQRQGLAMDNVRTILESRDGSLWIGTMGGGLSHLKDGRFTTYRSRDGLAHDWVRTIHEDRSGGLWIGTDGGGLSCLKDGRFTNYSTQSTQLELPGNLLRVIYEDRNGSLWIGTFDRGLVRMKDGRFTTYTTQHGLPDNCVLVIHEEPDGSLWIGTKGGLSRLQNGTFTTYTTQTTQQGLAGNWVRAIHRDRNGSLWIGTLGGGLSRLKDGKFISITKKEGLFDDDVWVILDDDRGNFWMTSNHGVFRTSQKELNAFCDGKIKSVHCISYNEKDGMKARECNGGSQPAGCKTRDGKLWFPTMTGMAMVDPGNIKTNPTPPPVVIEKITVGTESIDPLLLPKGQKPVFSPGNNELEIRYTGLSLSVPERVLFKTKLEGYDTRWKEMGQRRIAYYTSLPAGNYTFRVTACNNDGLWNETGASISFYLTPYFYQAGWFYILVSLLLVLTGYVVYRVFLLKGREKKLALMVDSRTRDLKERNIELENAGQLIERKNQMLESQTEQLTVQAEKLKEMDKVKSRFFANISHEFRTPLTLIMGPLEQMLSQTPEKEQEKKLSMMFRNSQRLLGLINQLLELSKFDSGKVTLQAAPQNIVTFIKGITASFEMAAGKKRQDLSFHGREQHITVYFDPEKLEKAICNLLSNALKFTPTDGKITVAVEPVPDKSSGFPSGAVNISVSDTGPGIPAEQLANLFDRFYQADNTYEHHHKGSGIGLAIAKEIVELHHGTIDVAPIEGEGTVFGIHLPLGSGHLEPDQITHAPAVTPEAGRYLEIPNTSYGDDIAGQDESADETACGKDNRTLFREAAGEEKEIILVVEDSAGMREYIRSALEPEYIVAEAKNGREGIRKAGEIGPDMVISDIMMPEADGYELCRTLKKDINTSHIPVVLLTAKAAEEDIIDGLETGADDYITKPFNTRILLSRVKNLINLRRQLQHKIQRELVLQPTEIAVSSIDQEFLKSLKETIEANLSDPEFGVTQLAGSLYMGRTSLNLKIKALTGESSKRFIQSYRLKRAAQLLKDHFGNVTEVAFEAGFGSSAYFTKCFKEKFHQLPHVYQASEGR